MNEKRKIIISVGLLLSLIIVGIVGYRYLLDVTLIDALYMTIITISTVGYTEVAPMGAAAKLFSVFLIFFSIGTVGYLVSNILASFIEGDIKEALKKRRMENKIDKLKDHYILCGSGETGTSIVQYLTQKNVSFVVIDNNEKVVQDLIDHGVLAILGNATSEEVLEMAQIRKAKGLIASLSKDSFNVYTVLTARQLNPNLNIVAKAVDKSAHEKLRKAGADNTISPNEIGGRRMAASMVRPTIISFLDSITMAGEVELDLEDVLIMEHSELCSQTLKEARIPEKTGLIVMAIRREGERKMKFNPNSDEKILPKDSLIVLGTEKQVNQLRELAKDTGER